MNMAAPDFAEKIAERLAAQYLAGSIAFDVDQREIVTVLMGIAARDGYILALGGNRDDHI